MPLPPKYGEPIVDDKGVPTRPFYLFTTSIGTPVGPFSVIPQTPSTGSTRVITDSPVNGWGNTIATGGGANTVFAWFNGVNWRVMGA